jgi:ankyrin repeat protein
LIGAGADVNSKNPNAFTALHAASFFDTEAKIVKKLIEAHAKLDPIWNKESPLHIASQRGAVKIVEILVSAGANVDLATSDNTNQTPLHLVCGGNLEVAKILIANTANIDAVDSEGETALFKACRKGHADIARELIDAGAKINQATKNEVAPIDIACLNYNTEIVQILFNAGANVDPEIKKQIQGDQQKTYSTADERIEMINLIDKITTAESIEKRDKKLENRRQPSSDVNSAGAGLVADQEAGARSPR